MIPNAIQNFFRGSAIPLTLASGRVQDQPLVLVNDAFCRMSGYGRDEIVGRNCRFLQGQDRSQGAREEIRNAIATGRDLQVTLINYKRDGARFGNLLFMYALNGSDGLPDYFMGSQFELKPSARLGDLAGHADVLDAGIARILAETQHIHIKTRQLLAEAAVGVLRAKIGLLA